MAEHNRILYILHPGHAARLAETKEELLPFTIKNSSFVHAWLHPVINHMQLVLSVGYYGQTACFGASGDTSFFIYGLVSNINLDSCMLFHLYRKQAIF